MSETLLNYSEAAAYLGCKVDTLQRWSARHDIERIKYPNGQVKFKKEFLDEYIERHIQEPRPVERPEPSPARRFRKTRGHGA